VSKPPPPERKEPETLSGEYLQAALDALEGAGDPRMLYSDSMRKDPPKGNAMGIALVLARRKSLQLRLQVVLYTAFAAEAYVNEFLAVTLKGHPKKDQAAIDRFSTLNKYVFGTHLALGEPLFQRHDPWIKTLTELFDLRDELVHPRPGFGPSGLTKPKGGFEKRFEPQPITTYLVIVAALATVMGKRAKGPKSLSIPADIIWLGREAVVRYAGTRLSVLPRPTDESEPPLFRQAIDAASGRDGEEAQ
jgi:hypothetical protein